MPGLLESWHLLPMYMRLPTAREAVLAPLALSIALLTWQRGRGFPAWHALVFVAGLMLTEVFSLTIRTPDVTEIHSVPGYLLLLVLLPKELRPSAAQGYALTFLNLLLCDAWGVIRLQVSSSSGLQPDFYFGIGGAGFSDALFVAPLLAIGALLALNTASNLPFANQPISSLILRISRRKRHQEALRA